MMDREYGQQFSARGVFCSATALEFDAWEMEGSEVVDEVRKDVLFLKFPVVEKEGVKALTY